MKIVLHVDKSDVFEEFEIVSYLPTEVIKKDLWVKHGDRVECFEGTNNAIGTLMLRFDDADGIE